MTRSSIAIALAMATALTAGAMSQANAATDAKASSHDKMFIIKAMQGDIAEIQFGKLAQQKGTTSQVKQLGQTLVTDHSKNLDKAKQLASSIGVTPPSQPNSKEQTSYAKADKLSGTAFDAQFAQDMVRDHKATIEDFKKEAKESGAVGQFAQQSLPTLQKHLKMAQAIEAHK